MFLLVNSYNQIGDAALNAAPRFSEVPKSLKNKRF
jgi:hypothetical protein